MDVVTKATNTYVELGRVAFGVVASQNELKRGFATFIKLLSCAQCGKFLWSPHACTDCSTHLICSATGATSTCSGTNEFCSDCQTGHFVLSSMAQTLVRCMSALCTYLFTNGKLDLEENDIIRKLICQDSATSAVKEEVPTTPAVKSGMLKFPEVSNRLNCDIAGSFHLKTGMEHKIICCQKS